VATSARLRSGRSHRGGGPGVGRWWRAMDLAWRSRGAWRRRVLRGRSQSGWFDGGRRRRL